MPKLVSEIVTGNSFGRSVEGGALADRATRAWRVILNRADEVWSIPNACGVSIGDRYSDEKDSNGDYINPTPCVSIEAKPDGESRLVWIATATYQTSAGDGGDEGEDPYSIDPDVRPANFSTSTTLYEVPAYEWGVPGVLNPNQIVFVPIVNPVGDPIDGITKMEPITTIRITQFEPQPGTRFSAYVGHINKEKLELKSKADSVYLTCEPHTVLFRGVEATPHIESFGTATYRGFMNIYEFSYKRNYCKILDEVCGWDATTLVTGFNCKAINPVGAAMAWSVPLKRHPNGDVVQPLALPDGTAVGDKIRALVKVHDPVGGSTQQQPSAQPIALNDDGTPRDTDAEDPKVLVWKRQVQPDIDLAAVLNLRLG